MRKYLFFLFAFLPVLASAEAVEIDGLWYSLNEEDRKAEVIEYKNDQQYSGDVTIPDVVTYNNVDYSVEIIGSNAFLGCSGLTSVFIPNSVVSIFDGAFAGCTGLTSIRVASGNAYLDSRDNCNAIITKYDNILIAGCKNSTIPNSVTSIGAYAFSECSGLTSITIPTGVTSIGEFAFYECSGLTSINIPNSVTSIGINAFYECSGLTSVHITDLAAWCNIYFEDSDSNPLCWTHHLFLNGEEITDLVIPNSVTSIGAYAFFKCSGLTSVTIGNSVTSIGSSAFGGCSSLTSVHITDLAAWCNISFEFSNSNPLNYAHHLYLNGEEVKDLVIPNSVTSIGKSTFEGCSGLTSVTIGNSVTSIGMGAFSDCSGLTSVTIGNSVTSIGDFVFSECTGLTSVTIPNSVTTIGYAAFAGCSNLTSVHINDIAAWCKISFSDSSSNPLSHALQGRHLFLNGEEVKELVIPNSVTSIGNYAFYGCSGLTSITIPNSVTSIGNYAFQGFSTSLTEVYCYAEEVPSTYSNAFEITTIGDATLYVLASAYEAYRTTEPWSLFGTIVTIDEPTLGQCAIPTITYANGKVRFACETEGVEFVPSIKVTPNQLQNGNELAIGGTFTVSVYAVKEGYDNSDTATMTINMSQMGDVNADGELNAADITAVVNAILGK